MNSMIAQRSTNIRGGQRTPACLSGVFFVGLLFLGLPPASFAGVITVSSNADDNVRDDQITLREALLIARGGRGPSQDEALLISGDVGKGIDDTINVPGERGTITLAAPLPELDDAKDGIHAASSVVLQGANTQAPAFRLSTDNHTIVGFTLQGFGRDFGEASVTVMGAGNTLRAMTVRNSQYMGVHITGPRASANTISDCIVDGSNGDGIWLSDGANTNTITNTFVYRNKGNGIWLDGQGTNQNRIIECGIGLTETLAAAGNRLGAGVQISHGARENRLGDPTNPKRYTYISFNERGGIRIADPGTDGNILHSLWLGYDPQKPEGSGNGSLQSGITVRNAAKNNQIGQKGAAGFIMISGHSDNGIA